MACDSQPPARVAALVAAAQALVSKLDEVHASPAMQAVWVLHHVHGGNYVGPQYGEELKALKTALSADALEAALPSASGAQEENTLTVEDRRFAATVLEVEARCFPNSLHGQHCERVAAKLRRQEVSRG